jgi:hypothetical protein
MKIGKIIFMVFLFTSSVVFAQKGTLKGIVKDAVTGESLIGANVIYGPGMGTVTDIDGNYTLSLDYGHYDITVSYVGYETVNKQVDISSAALTISFELSYTMLSEVEVFGDIATSRETPVAFSTLDPIKLDEELASQDIPLILNSTPGVYATQQGGGDGDARINIRGFNQRNVAVMLDGIPVNDMENGWVYWSNWFGLDVVMRKTQIQRGLGASKLAIPSVGGTINIQTKGIGAKKKLLVKQEVANDGFLRTSVGLTSGQMKNGWGITAAGSYKRGNGWVDMTWTEGWFYFLRVDKDLGNHRLSFKAMGAPQKHGQRSYKKSIAEFDSAYAIKQGIKHEEFLTGKPVGLGLKYNPNWGNLDRYSLDGDDNKISNGNEKLSATQNYYHKPMFSISDFWNVSEKVSMSNIVYLSIGSGGGTGVVNSTNTLPNGLVDFQTLYDANYNGRFNPDQESTGILRTAINNHFWYGFLSTVDYQINETLNLSGGLDLRSYKGEHYREVYDLLGGKYFYDDPGTNENEAPKTKKMVGDIYAYHNDGLVNWGGLFGQLKYNKGKFSSFINLTISNSGYKRVDYFKPKMLELSDTTLRIAYDTEIEYQGVTYDRNSPGLEFLTSDWKWILGSTFKGGVNYNINDHMNVFTNFGYISKAPRFQNVYDYGNELFRDINNEKIKAVELGYSYYNSSVTFNINTYYTVWEDKPADRGRSITIDDRPYSVNINGMDALHKGVEMEFAYKVLDNLMFESLLSVGDWKWTSADSARIYDDNQNLKDVVYFDAEGIYVGDAAQLQGRLGLRWEIIKELYVKSSFTYFGKYYSEFDPLDLDPIKNDWAFNENGTPKQSWKIPDYYLVDLHAGYGIKFRKVKFNLRGSILNLFDQEYISDADNNDKYSGQSYNSFDAKSAAVFFGMGRRFNISLQLTF